jgi:predicted transglutaminase-like protease
MADYSNRDMTQGALFINNRKKQTNHPDFRGELTLSKALLKELVEKVKEGKEAKLSLAVWKKKSKAGNEYQSIAASIFTDYKKDGGRSNDFEVPF